MKERARVRRFHVALLAAVMAAFTLSSATMAAKPPAFVAKLSNTVCTHTGSTYGLGTLDTTGTIIENRKNGTNYMRIEGTMQQRVGGKWEKVHTYAPYRTVTFPNDATSHSLEQPFAWAFRDFEVGATMRWKLKFEWWDQRPGKDRKLATKFKTSAPCTA